MRPADNINDLIKKLKLKASTDLDRRIHDDISMALAESDKTKTAVTQPNIGRTIMKSPIAKVAIAAVIVIAVLIGIDQLGGSSTSVVWAEVAQRIQASRGVIFRNIVISQDLRDNEPVYTMNYLTSTHSRLDSYKADQIVKTIYSDFNTKTVILVDHLPNHKSYVKMTFENMEQSSLLVDHKNMIQRFLSCEHTQLGQKTIEGVLCEGIETTDSSDSLVAQVWVSVETGYPVQLEIKIVRNNGETRIGGVVDQFQWDVELDDSVFEPNIPPDYIDVSP
jgi:hypothetical protein